MSMNAWNDAKGKLHDAEKYLAMIGKPQRTTLEAMGELTGISVKTRVRYQPTDGAKNYHECPAFDFALAEAIGLHFHELREEAIRILQDEVTRTGKAARESVEKMLAQIDAYEKE